MDRFRQLAHNRWGAYSIAALVGVVAYLAITNMTGILSWLASGIRLLSPIIIGIVIAYVINLIVEFFENKVFRKWENSTIRSIVSVALSFLIVLFLALLFLWFLLPKLIESISEFVVNAKNYNSIIKTNLANLDEYASGYGIKLNASKWADSMYSELDKNLSTITMNLSNALNTVMTVWSIVLNIFIGIILAVYFLLGKKKLYAGLDNFRRALLTKEQYARHTDFLRRSSEIFSKYISYTLLEALGVGLVNALFMIIAELPNVALISVVVGVTNILPTFGPIIGCFIGAFILLLDKPVYALIFVIFTMILQTIDGYVVKPHLFGNLLGISSAVSLVSIIIGGKLFGSIGILLAIPFTAVLAILYHETFLPWLERRKTVKYGPDQDPAEDTVPAGAEVAAEVPAEVTEEVTAEAAENATV